MKKKKLQTTSNIFEKLPWNVLTYELLQYYEFPYDIKDSKQGIQQLFLIRKTRMVKKKVMKDGKEIEIEEEEEYMKVVVFFPTIIIKGEKITINIFNKLYYRTLRITFLSCTFKYFDSDDLLKMNSLTNLTFNFCSFIEKTDTFKLNFPKNLEVFKMQFTSFYKETFSGMERHPFVTVILSENTTLRKLEFTSSNIAYFRGIEKNKNLISLDINRLYNCYFLNKMTYLEYLEIECVQNDIRVMEDVNYPKLKELFIHSDNTPIVLPRFGKIPKVKKFKSFASISQNGDLSILNGFTNLEELDINIFVRLETKTEDGWNLYYPLMLKRLKRLELRISELTVVDVQFEDITFLSDSPNIEYLEINGKLKSLNGLSKFDKLIDVSVTSRVFNTTIPIISEIIKRLSFTTYGAEWKTLKIFAGCKNLKRLSLTTYGTDWRHFKIFAECKNLETLNIHFNGKVDSFDGIDELKNLKSLSIWYIVGYSVKNIHPFDITSKSLKEIKLTGFIIDNLYFLNVPNIVRLELLLRDSSMRSMYGIEEMPKLKTLIIPYRALILPHDLYKIKEYLAIPEGIKSLINLTINVLRDLNSEMFTTYTVNEFYDTFTYGVIEKLFYKRLYK